MDALLGNIFLSIQARIVATLPEIKWIDQDFGQLEYFAGEKPEVILPAVCFDIVDCRYQELGMNTQLCEAALDVKLAVGEYIKPAHVHSQAHRELALNYYNIEHRLNKALHGWCDGLYFTPLIRVNVHTQKRKDQLRVRPLRYTFSFTDDTTINVSPFAGPYADTNITASF